MTIKEFSEKYRIPYSIIYEASFNTSPVPQYAYYRKEYSEKDLFDAVKETLEQRIDRHRKQMVKNTEYLNRLGVST